VSAIAVVILSLLIFPVSEGPSKRLQNDIGTNSAFIRKVSFFFGSICLCLKRRDEDVLPPMAYLTRKVHVAE
jgi:hypothetical protein